MVAVKAVDVHAAAAAAADGDAAPLRYEEEAAVEQVATVLARRSHSRTHTASIVVAVGR